MGITTLENRYEDSIGINIFPRTDVPGLMEHSVKTSYGK